MNCAGWDIPRVAVQILVTWPRDWRVSERVLVAVHHLDVRAMTPMDCRLDLEKSLKDWEKVATERLRPGDRVTVQTLRTPVSSRMVSLAALAAVHRRDACARRASDCLADSRNRADGCAAACGLRSCAESLVAVHCLTVWVVRPMDCSMFFRKARADWANSFTIKACEGDLETVACLPTWSNSRRTWERALSAIQPLKG